MGVFGTGLSIMVFRNPVTAAGMFGYCVTMAGVCIFVFEKRKDGAPMNSLAKAIPVMDEEKQTLVRGKK